MRKLWYFYVFVVTIFFHFCGYRISNQMRHWGRWSLPHTPWLLSTPLWAPPSLGLDHFFSYTSIFQSIFVFCIFFTYYFLIIALFIYLFLFEFEHFLGWWGLQYFKSLIDGPSIDSIFSNSICRYMVIWSYFRDFKVVGDHPLV